MKHVHSNVRFNMAIRFAKSLDFSVSLCPSLNFKTHRHKMDTELDNCYSPHNCFRFLAYIVYSYFRINQDKKERLLKIPFFIR